MPLPLRIFAALLLAALVPLAHADPVAYRFTVRVTDILGAGDVTGPVSIPGGTVALNDVLSGRLWYDPALLTSYEDVGSGPGHIRAWSAGATAYAGIEWRDAHGALIGPAPLAGSMMMLSDYAPGTSYDFFTIDAHSADGLQYTSFNFIDPSATAVSSYALPASLAGFSDVHLDAYFWNRENDETRIVAELTSLVAVPEPAQWALLAAGLLLLRRRRAG